MNINSTNKLLILILLLVLGGIGLSVHAQQFKQINIEIEQDSINELESHPYTNDDVHGNFIVDGIRFDSVEIHYRGAYYLWKLIRKTTLRNWKIKTPDAQKFENRREWNFNYENYIRQNLAYHVFREAGVPCVSAENVILSVNGVKQGLYLKYEDPDNKEWLEEVFGDGEGELYKAAFDMPGQVKYFADLSYLGDLDEDYFLHYRKQTNNNDENSSDYQDLRAFIRFINFSSDEDFEKLITNGFAVDEFIKYLVVSNFIANWDSYPFRAKNYFLYYNRPDHIWHFIPWDLDGTFQEAGIAKNYIGTTGSVFHYLDTIEEYNYAPDETLERPFVWRLMKTERFRNQYIWEYKQATESFLSIPNLTLLVDSIAGRVVENTSGKELEDFRTDVSNTRAFIEARLANVIAELDQYDAEDPYVTDAELKQREPGRLHIYPNPASTIITVELPVLDPGSIDIHIINILGQTVSSKSLDTRSLDTNMIDINVADLPYGQYIVVVKSTNRLSSQKLNITD